MCIKCQEKLSKLSENANFDWNVACLQWKFKNYYKEHTHCICHEEIEHVFVLINTENGIEQKLGCVCINTVFKNNKKLISDVNNKNKERNRVLCVHCGVYGNMYSHTKSLRHKQNENLANARKLHECKTCKLIKAEPKFDYCNSCYSKYKGYRHFCKKCKDYISPEQSFYGNKCFYCNLKKKGITEIEH